MAELISQAQKEVSEQELIEIQRATIYALTLKVEKHKQRIQKLKGQSKGVRDVIQEVSSESEDLNQIRSQTIQKAKEVKIK